METEGSRVKSLLQTLALYVEARGRLLQIEAQEAGSRFTQILVLAVLLSGLLLFGWMLALPALVFLVANSQNWDWWWVALGAAGIHFFLAFIFVLALISKLKKLRIFEETFRQFQKDRDCLGTPTQHRL
jgi:uncharacterized membrane protein YqjE